MTRSTSMQGKGVSVSVDTTTRLVTDGTSHQGCKTSVTGAHSTSLKQGGPNLNLAGQDHGKSTSSGTSSVSREQSEVVASVNATVQSIPKPVVSLTHGREPSRTGPQNTMGPMSPSAFGKPLESHAFDTIGLQQGYSSPSLAHAAVLGEAAKRCGSTVINNLSALVNRWPIVSPP